MEIFDAYLSRMRRRDRRPKSLSNYGRIFDQFCWYCEEAGINPTEATEDELEDYLHMLGQRYAAHTVRGHLRALRSAYRYAHRRGRVAADPTVEIESPRIPDREPEIVPPADIGDARRECRTGRDEILWGLMALTGMRRIEVCRLSWMDVNLKAATLRVHGKGDKLRLVPIHPVLGEILAGAPQRIDHHVLPNRQGGEMGETTFDYRLHRITAHKAHSFRRTVASNLHHNDVPTETIEKILGWAPRSVLSRFYLNVADHRMIEAIGRLYSDCPIAYGHRVHFRA